MLSGTVPGRTFQEFPTMRSKTMKAGSCPEIVGAMGKTAEI
jgi:hypothetical protein